MTAPLVHQYADSEVLAEMVAIAQAALVDNGIEVLAARDLSHTITERIRLGLGGSYIPRGKSMDVNRIRLDILTRWNGDNTHMLCQEHGISERRLRQLNEEARRDANPARPPGKIF